MRTILALLLATAACTEHGHTAGDAAVPPDALLPPDAPAPFVNDTDPAHCTHVTLVARNDDRSTLGPFTVGATTACLTLDAEGIPMSTFSAETRREPGMASSFVLTLVDGNNNVVMQGQDVVFGLESPQVFQKLDVVFDIGGTRNLVLFLQARPGRQAETDVAMSYGIIHD
jgi:hypothetical protein